VTRRAFNLTELLVCVGIVAVLIGLLCPAVQQIREAGFRAQCMNNLHQLGLAAHTYHSDHGRLPDGGIGTRYTDWECGWFYRLAPYLEANVTRSEGAGKHAQKVLFCPSRRIAGLDTFEDGARLAGNDYAGNVGTNMWYGDWTPGNAAFVWSDHTDGLIAPRPYSLYPYRPYYGDGPGVSLARVPAGSSNVLLAAEKRMDSLLVGQRQWGEGNDWTWGASDWQTVRVTAYPPARDWRGGPPLSGWGSWDKDGAFGSAHRAGLNCLAGDGSVRFVAYTVAPSVWLNFGRRTSGAAETW
jgi:hypothetical protein